VCEGGFLGWLLQIPGGQAELGKFMETMWKPAKDAFRRNEPETALRITCDYFSGKGSFDQVPAEARQALMDNIGNGKLSPHREIRSRC